MRYGPAVLRGAAVIAWGATLTGAFTGFDGEPGFSPLDFRIWLCAVSAAVLASWAAIQHYLIDRASQAANAMTRAALTRPFDHGTGPMLKAATGPLPKISLLDGPAPAAAPAARHRRGAHAANPR